MTLAEIGALALFQAGYDESDQPDFEPALTGYVNEGYQKLLRALGCGELRLREQGDIPNLPLRLHRSLADYACWMLMRNGNALRQQRGAVFLQAFEAVCAEAASSRNRKMRFHGIDGAREAAAFDPLRRNR